MVFQLFILIIIPIIFGIVVVSPPNTAPVNELIEEIPTEISEKKPELDFFTFSLD